MDEEATSKLVRRLYEAFLSGDRNFYEEALADDFTFTSPYDEPIDSSMFFVRCWPTRESIRAIHIENLLVQGEHAFVLYTCETTDGRRFRNVEHLIFHEKELRKVEVYFGDPPSGITRGQYQLFLKTANEAWKAKLDEQLRADVAAGAEAAKASDRPTGHPRS